jgi:hypothetical protein
MIYTFTTPDRGPADIEVSECQCGEPAFVETDRFIRWQRCASCADHRVLTWTSIQTPTLVLTGHRAA